MRRAGDLQPIVVIGAARSGTKVMRDALSVAADAGRVPYDVGYVWRYGNESVDHDCLTPDHVRARTRALVRSYVSRYANADGVVVEKTVGNTLRVDYVRAVLPEARFVYLERDGVDVAMSARREWRAPTDWLYIARKARHFPLRLAPTYGRNYLKAQTIDRHRAEGHVATWGPRYPGIDADLARDGLLAVCARQWRWSVTSASSMLANVPSPVARVSYEELVSAPADTLARVLYDLSVPHETADLERAVAMIEPGMARLGRSVVNDVEREILRKEIGSTLERQGHEQL